MSAWLCGNNTLSLVVDVIKSDDFRENYDVATELYSDKTEMELLEELSYLNTKSLNCRYGESEDHVLEDKEYVSLDMSDAQKCKSVACYLYQTCECEENYDNLLFKLLDQWYEDTEEQYDNEWKDCVWDMDSPLVRIENGKAWRD